MKKQRQQTPEEREAWKQGKEQQLSGLIQRLEDGVKAIKTGDDFRRYLATAARFHRYSFGNAMLIMLQRPDATRVAGYTTWQTLGRQVRKGEKGIEILAPAPITIKQTDEQSGQETEKKILRFRVAYTFDISQTDGEPLPEPVRAEVLDGLEGEAEYSALVAYAQAQGLTVTNYDAHTNGDDSKSRYRGYYSPAKQLIFVKRGAPAQMLKTLIHELGHAEDEQLDQASPEERETVAEATAYMVAAACGIDTGCYSFPYIANWTAMDNGTETIRRVMERTQKIASRLIDAIDAHQADADADAATEQEPAALAAAA